ncbi:hypothetical protein FF011L_01520 [Roseimaritima multifibrata]|uniref:Carboxypeptidase regulatory-like domain-containing protein n=2 Tax=Roseimaritima multifibrata TaxID=1930274 RepID=A0A517M962_9BACT|nr:hypothetical protein FF011L_01520 [Roseimaritima multifibrata]
MSYDNFVETVTFLAFLFPDQFRNKTFSDVASHPDAFEESEAWKLICNKLISNHVSEKRYFKAFKRAREASAATDDENRKPCVKPIGVSTNSLATRDNTQVEQSGFSDSDSAIVAKPPWPANAPFAEVILKASTAKRGDATHSSQPDGVSTSGQTDQMSKDETDGDAEDRPGEQSVVETPSKDSRVGSGHNNLNPGDDTRAEQLGNDETNERIPEFPTDDSSRHQAKIERATVDTDDAPSPASKLAPSTDAGEPLASEEKRSRQYVAPKENHDYRRVLVVAIGIIAFLITLSIIDRQPPSAPTDHLTPSSEEKYAETVEGTGDLLVTGKLTGQVVDAKTAQPIVDATVTVYEVNGLRLPDLEIVTDDRGEYKLAIPGRYASLQIDVQAAKPDYRQRSKRIISLDSYDGSPVEIVLHPDETNE